MRPDRHLSETGRLELVRVDTIWNPTTLKFSDSGSLRTSDQFHKVPWLRSSWKAAKSEIHVEFLYLACVSLFLFFLELPHWLFHTEGKFDILQGIIFFF